MKVRNHRDLWAGAMFVAFGVAFAAFSQRYEVGTAARMGPGYFPAALGILLAILGVAILGSSLTRAAVETRLAPVGWREIATVLAAVALFAACLIPLGIVVSLVVLIFVSAAASHEFSPRDTLVAAVVLLLLSYLVFVRGLELQFPVWPYFVPA